MKFFPNPVQDDLTIKFKLTSDDVVQVSITDLSGRLHASSKDKHNAAAEYSELVDFSHLSTGIYFITLVTSNFKETKKIMIIKL